MTKPHDKLPRPKIPRPLSENRDRLKTEDEMQREKLGPRGVPGEPDPARMVPQQKKNTPADVDDGHTA